MQRSGTIPYQSLLRDATDRPMIALGGHMSKNALDMLSREMRKTPFRAIHYPACIKDFRDTKTRGIWSIGEELFDKLYSGSTPC